MGNLEISKAVIPAAGLGTRLLPATAGIPKELLPVGLKPMIQHCLEEAIQSGLKEIAIILSPQKSPIRTFLREAASSSHPALEEFARLLRGARIEYLEQTRPHGVADALSRARDFTSGEPFAVLLPDNVCFASTPPVRQMLTRLEPGRCALALIEYRRETADWFGNCGRVDCEPIEDPVYRITRLHDKGTGTFDLRGKARELVGYARYLLQPYFFDYLEETTPADPGQEWDDTPVLQKIILDRQMTGVHLTGEAFDVGNPAGYLAANRFAGVRSRGTPPSRGLPSPGG